MKLYEHIKRIVIIAFIFIYLISCFTDSPLPVYIGGVLLIPMYIWFLPQMPKVNLIICSLILAVGLAASILSHMTFTEFLAAMMVNSGIGAMFLCVPMLCLPFYYERYQDELRSVAYRHMNKAFTFLVLTVVSSFVLSSVLNMAAIPILYVLLIENARIYKVERLFMGALLQSFAITGCFSPMWMQVPLLLTSYDLSLEKTMPLGLGLGALLGIVCLLGLLIQLKRTKGAVRTTPRDMSIQVNWRMLWTLLALAVILIAAIVILNAVCKIKILAAIPIVSVPYAFFAALALKKLPNFRKGTVEYYNGAMMRHCSEFVLMVSAGFMGSALVKLGASSVVRALFPPAVLASPILIFFVIAAAYIAVTLVGVNASVVTTVFAMTLTPAALGVSPLILTLLFCAMHALSQMMSPVSGASMLASSLHKITPLTAGPGLNGVFGLVSAVLVCLILGAAAM